MGKTDDQKHNLISRLHRLEGQVRALEHQLDNPDPLVVIGQFTAAIAALRACLLLYGELAVENSDESTKLRIISRLIRG